MRIDRGKVALAILPVSRRMCLSCKALFDPTPPRPKLSNCLTTPTARCALDSIRASNLSRSSFEGSSRSIGVHIMIGARILFKSWEMPLAKLPMLSSLWVCRSFASSSCWLVMSVKIPCTPTTSPDELRNGALRTCTTVRGLLTNSCSSIASKMTCVRITSSAAFRYFCAKPNGRKSKKVLPRISASGFPMRSQNRLLT